MAFFPFLPSLFSFSFSFSFFFQIFFIWTYFTYKNGWQLKRNKGRKKELDEWVITVGEEGGGPGCSWPLCGMWGCGDPAAGCRRRGGAEARPASGDLKGGWSCLWWLVRPLALHISLHRCPGAFWAAMVLGRQPAFGVETTGYPLGL